MKCGTNPNHHQPTGVVETAQVYCVASSYSTSLAGIFMCISLTSHMFPYICIYIYTQCLDPCQHSSNLYIHLHIDKWNKTQIHFNKAYTKKPCHTNFICASKWTRLSSLLLLLRLKCGQESFKRCPTGFPARHGATRNNGWFIKYISGTIHENPIYKIQKKWMSWGYPYFRKPP